MEKQYSQFVDEALASGLTKEQADFLWNWINKIAREKALSGGFI